MKRIIIQFVFWFAIGFGLTWYGLSLASNPVVDANGNMMVVR